jgi:ribosomal protein L12E/L44/L45/RPP1/RPP2
MATTQRIPAVTGTVTANPITPPTGTNTGTSTGTDPGEQPVDDYGLDFTKQGTGESWYGDNAYQYGTQGLSESLMPDVVERTTGTTQTEQGDKQWSPQLSAPSYTENAYGDNNRDIGNSHNEENWYTNNGDQWSEPGKTDAVSTYGINTLQNPSAVSEWDKSTNASAQWAAPGTIAGTRQNANNAVNGANSLQNFANTQGQGYAAPSYTENAVGNATRSVSQPGTIQAVGANALSDLSGQGYGEQVVRSMANQGPSGLTNNSQTVYSEYTPEAINADMSAYYDNARRKSTESLDAANAARGMFGSSFAMDQNSEALTNLSADEAKANAQWQLDRAAEMRQQQGLRGTLASAADESARGNDASSLAWYNAKTGASLDAQNAGLSRTLAGNTIAGDMDAQRLASSNASMAYAGQTDESLMKRLSMGEGLSSSLDEQVLDKEDAKMGWAGDVDAEQRARLTGGQNLKVQEDSTDLARLTGMTNIAGAGDAEDRARLTGGQTSAKGADTSNLNRAETRTGITTAADKAFITRAVTDLQSGKDVDAADLNDLKVMLQGAAGADSALSERLQDWYDTAVQAQKLQTTRGTNAYQQTKDMSDSLSAILQSAYKDITDTDLKLLLESLGMSTGAASQTYSNAVQQGNSTDEGIGEIVAIGAAAPTGGASVAVKEAKDIKDATGYK